MNLSRKTSLSEQVDLYAGRKYDYYNQWMFDEPLLISKAEDEDIQALQKILYKFIIFFVQNYDDWSHLMPLNPESRRVFDSFKDRPYTSGSYRVDTVFDQNRQQKIIETTCRFALNGFFIASNSAYFSRAYQATFPGCPPAIDRHPLFMEYLEKLIGDHKRIIVLKNADSRNSSKFFIPIFKDMGFDVVVILPEEVDRRKDELKSGFVVSELSIEELESLSDETLAVLSTSDMINDLRTVILVHDKRFYSVLGSAEIRETVLSSEEIALLDVFYVPTYSNGEAPEVWEEARKNKESWILKHRSLGKSEEVYAGAVTSEEEWQLLFVRADLKEFVLQRWIEQMKFDGTVNGEAFSDFVTGTLLFFDDNYFGPGFFRTSSFPVTNVTDDRKMFCVTLA
jgi:hypothetical protein